MLCVPEALLEIPEIRFHLVVVLLCSLRVDTVDCSVNQGRQAPWALEGDGCDGGRVSGQGEGLDEGSLAGKHES